MNVERISVRVDRIRVTGATGSAGAVAILDLLPDAGVILPPFVAGAHIDLHLTPDLIRQYSLLNDPADSGRYVVAVALDADSRGGSRHLHEQVSEGDVITVSAPRCHFPLIEDAAHSVLIAGGIGVTPLWAMAQRLRTLGRPFSFHFGARSAANAPLLNEIAPVLEGLATTFETVFEADHGARLDLARIFAEAPAGSHFYACGPSGMLDAYVDAAEAAGVNDAVVHLERFSGTGIAATGGGFTVELARTGGCYAVAQGSTILETLKAAGINIPHSCAEGVCGACEATVLDGVPDHRDEVLSDAEKAANRTMMVCCSGARSAHLVLDL
ncbi:PDR/VanB family oxidoreductase [Sphingomonas phyllosphaerae]|uniref:PDR/VanB family oxidoreductase n=1 Tax=Sphingomonas phyllosphaerae TaxID=257003 RepID=UPI00241366AE|nr:PDR/VanB family oxidoreductase [Sphingomonas phyllosphaerae]